MTARFTIAQINAMDRSTFIDTFDGIYEHSPWVAEHVWQLIPFKNGQRLKDAMRKAVGEAAQEEQLELLRMHPRLGVKVNLTDYSHTEQVGAGLLAASTDQRDVLAELNDAYEKKFGFPFIIAVKDLTLQEIIDSCRNRMKNDATTEFDDSLAQVHRIAGFRLADMIAEDI